MDALGAYGSDCRVLCIHFATSEQLRSRRVVSRSRARPTGKYPSWKMGRMLQWESLNELNAFRLLDCDPDVTAFVEQPCEILYLDDGQLRKHYPDIYVEKGSIRELWEVKSEFSALQGELSKRTDVLTRGLAAYGFTYRVVLASELRQEPRLQNAKTILRFGRRMTNDDDREYVQRVLKKDHRISWADACNGRFGSRGRKTVCYLVLQGIVSLEMDSPLNATSQFLKRKE